MSKTILITLEIEINSVERLDTLHHGTDFEEDVTSELELDSAEVDALLANLQDEIIEELADNLYGLDVEQETDGDEPSTVRYNTINFSATGCGWVVGKESV
jgi:hypothetical protein